MFDIATSDDSEALRRTALIAADGRSVSYAELRQATSEARGALASDGKRLVFLRLANSPEGVAALFGAVDAGHAVALLDPEQGIHTLQGLVDIYRPDLILTPPEAPVLEGYAASRLIAGHTVLERAAKDPSPIHPDTDVLLATSGSTGSPKFVRLSRVSLIHNANSIADALSIGTAERAVGHLALHYSYGLSVLTSHLLKGASVAFPPGAFTSKEFWSHVRDSRATSLPGVPYHYEMLRRLDLDRLDDRAVKVLTQAGGRLRPDFVRHFVEVARRRGGRFHVMYGQTEAGPRMTTLAADDAVEHADSVGYAIPGGRLEIVDQDGRSAPTGEPGEVVYYGRNVMQGYATARADLAAGDLMNGRLSTGDIGCLDDLGRLRLSGRMSRFAKIFGVRISLDDVEKKIRGPWRRAALDQEGKLYIVLEGANDQECKAVAQALSGELGVHITAVLVRHSAELPTKANGKTDYSALREQVR